ncbi:undecaprenyl-diphosphate phosphatase [Buchnera aphidicola]|uniref:Undecaprenyl-diphosphatase n=1 Tax=Buchnera aphidicola (Artemisaphis artemisicola) TaxID=1241836 RepID=A0A4D6XIS4_9GAMM|nr:undecaprenyl-diphosphate phosphatase [Buchnera aphidicola]QCI15759.1 undecaprenyl-diphosphate phosphatase [Buchnera aphidicola (Artemisaphis artemisicola)]
MIYLHKLTLSIILGIIEGVTEFLPISSTGHMILVSHWLKVESNHENTLEIFVQLGSSLAILYFFRKKISEIIIYKNNFLNINTKNIHILISIVPTILIGFLYYKEIKTLFKIYNVMYSLILGGFFLLICEIFKPKKHKVNNIVNISFLQCIIIGFFQIFSLYPGFSRSGATIGTAILLGIKRSTAIEFSFIISIPLLIGASLFDLINNINKIKILDMPVFLFGFIISFVIASLFIKKLLKLINKTSLIFFGIYRFILSALIYLTN